MSRPGHKRGDPNESTKTLSITVPPGAEPSKLLAQAVLRPSVQAALTLQQFKVQDDVELTALVDELAQQAKLVNSGNFRRPEAILAVHAHTLDAIFNNLARHAAGNFQAGRNNGVYSETGDSYMRLALRAQSQCRATLETLAMVKNPPGVAFVRQANIANGPQQVNNASPATDAASSRPGKLENAPNELLEQADGKRMDSRAPKTAIGDHSAMATVGEIDGSADNSR